MIRVLATPAAASDASAGSSQCLGNRAVGDNSGARARTERSDARPQRRQHVAADDDVIGAVAERNVDGDGIGMFQWRSHGVTLDPVGWMLDRRAAAEPGAQRLDAFLDDAVVRHVARRSSFRSAF